ncbi:MAG: DUF1844 domain-containing protein [Deltaproteobacteria bacterium]|nr:DUF1844 domain-containing protein [Deltaproteobacteria bacterium]
MDTEDKGFTVRDRRSFDEGGDLKEENKTEETKEPASQPKEEKNQTGPTNAPPLPEVNFSSLIFSLSSSALLHMGEIADPQTGQKKVDIPMAKHSIDIISMLKDKTKGNLDNEEQQFIDNILTELRLRYVKAVKTKK